MASYLCDDGDGNAATFLITSLAEGEVLALCPDHLATWVAVMYHGVFETPDEPIGQTLPDPVTGDETDDDQAADDQPDNPIAEPGVTAPPTMPPAGDGDHVNPVEPADAEDSVSV